MTDGHFGSCGVQELSTAPVSPSSSSSSSSPATKASPARRKLGIWSHASYRGMPTTPKKIIEAEVEATKDTFLIIEQYEALVVLHDAAELETGSFRT